MADLDTHAEVRRNQGYEPHVKEVKDKLKQRIGRKRYVDSENKFIGEICLLAIRGGPEHGDFDHAQWRLLKDDLYPDPTLALLFDDRKLWFRKVEHCSQAVELFQWAEGDRRKFTLVVSCPSHMNRQSEDAADLRAELRRLLQEGDYERVEECLPQWGERCRVLPVMSCDSSSQMVTEPPLVPHVGLPPYRGVIIGPAGVGKTRLFNTVCGTRHASGSAPDSLTRQIFEGPMLSGDFHTVLRDTPALEAKKQSLEHAVLLWHGLCTERVHTIFIMLEYSARCGVLVDEFERIRGSYLQGRSEFYDRVVLIVSKWDIAEQEEREREFAELRKQLSQRVSPNVRFLCLSAKHSPLSRLCNMLSYFMRVHPEPVMLDLERDRFVVTSQSIAELTSQMREEKDNFERKAQEYTDRLARTLQDIEQEHRDEAALFLIAEYNERVQNMLDEILQQWRDRMDAVNQFCVWVELRKLAVRLTNSFRDMMIAHMTYSPDDASDPRNQIKKCPRCKCVWVKVAGCPSVQCGNVTRDRLMGGEEEKGLNWRHMHFDLRQAADGILQLCRRSVAAWGEEPRPKATPKPKAAPRRPRPINPTLYKMYDGPSQDSSPRAGCSFEGDWTLHFETLKEGEIRELFSCNSMEAAVQKYREQRQNPLEAIALAEQRMDTSVHLEVGCFATSKFKPAYESATPCDAKALKRCVQQIVAQFFRDHHLPEEDARHFSDGLAAACFEANPGEDPKFWALRVWTSGLYIDFEGRQVEFCHMLNEALAKDSVQNVARFIRTLNLFVVADRAASAPPLVFGPTFKTYRGGGLPDIYKPFFTEGKRYRVSRVLPTTVSEVKSKVFLSRQRDPCIRWTFQFQMRCQHVNYVDRTCPTVVADEEEYIFPPYSVFTVDSVSWKENPTPQAPHEVTLLVSEDNKDEPEDLPTAPWC